MKSVKRTFVIGAIEGGWRYKKQVHLLDSVTGKDVILRLRGSANRFEVPIERIILDPEAWRCFGKSKNLAPEPELADENRPSWIGVMMTAIDIMLVENSIDEGLNYAVNFKQYEKRSIEQADS